MQKHVPCPVRRHGGMRPVHPEGVSHGSSGGVSLVTSADRLSARRWEGMPPAAPDPRLTRAAPAATSPPPTAGARRGGGGRPGGRPPPAPPPREDPPPPAARGGRRARPTA